jgi:hypothetical protein
VDTEQMRREDAVAVEDPSPRASAYIDSEVVSICCTGSR